jgi:hypothetical protein
MNAYDNKMFMKREAIADNASFLMASLHDATFGNTSMRQANFLEAPGLYSVFSMTLSSRQDSLFGGIVIVEDHIELRFWAGCKEKLTETDLLKLLKQRHGNNSYAKQYKAAIKAINTMFQNDMIAHVWDYHLELYNTPHI